jgi:DNA-binding LytR/AlgR family response regulator
MGQRWPLLAGLYVWTVSSLGAAWFLHLGRRGSGSEADFASLLGWQAIVYGLWLPVAVALAMLLRRLRFGRTGLAAAALLAIPAVVLHACAAGLADVAWSSRMAEAGRAGAVVARLPVDLLFYIALTGAIWAWAAHREARSLAGALEAARAPQPEARAEETLLVSIGSRRVPVPIEAVEWLGAAGNYVVVNWDGRDGLVRSSMHEIEQRLSPTRFARVHRSTIANLALVESASSLSDGSWRLTMRSGAELVASRTYRDRILERLGRR